MSSDRFGSFVVDPRYSGEHTKPSTQPRLLLLPIGAWQGRQ
jgi:hypothetical protein